MKYYGLPTLAGLFLIYSFTYRRNVAEDLISIQEVNELDKALAPSDTNDPDSLLPYPFNGGESGGVFGEE
ncbi:MAG: hypothetical protein ACPGVV_07165, partial [Croceimicrobium sp.]